jgi:hypothetical protein
MSMGRRTYDLLRGYVSHEWDRIKDVERDLAERELREDLPPQQAKAATPTPPQAPEDKKTYARRLLGVTEESSFEDIRKAFTRLSKRSDPANFPVGSAEAKKASDIQRQVNWAFNELTDEMDATERRFRSLELD